MSEAIRKWGEIIKDEGVENIKHLDVELEKEIFTAKKRKAKVRVTITDPFSHPKTGELLLYVGSVIFEFSGQIEKYKEKELKKEIKKILYLKKGIGKALIESTRESTKIHVSYQSVSIDEVVNTMKKIEETLKKYRLL